MCRIFLAARCEASSRRFGRGLRTCSSAACRRTKRMFSAMLPEEDNQILRRDGELRCLRLTDRASAGRRCRSGSIHNSFRANPLSRPRCRKLALCARAQVQTPSRSRFCPGRRRGVNPARSTTADLRWVRCARNSAMAPHHTAKADQGPFTTEALGDADRGCAGVKAKGGARPPTADDHASHACRKSSFNAAEI
jgi:hypothetical protein